MSESYPVERIRSGWPRKGQKRTALMAQWQASESLSEGSKKR